jgi:hypothetical protein
MLTQRRVTLGMDEQHYGGLDDDTASALGQDPDLHSEAATLREVLTAYPETMTLDELTRELTFDCTDFGEQDQVERAVRDLRRRGLIHRSGDFVVPTRAAVRFWRLMNV